MRREEWSFHVTCGGWHVRAHFRSDQGFCLHKDLQALLGSMKTSWNTSLAVRWDAEARKRAKATSWKPEGLSFHVFLIYCWVTSYLKIQWLRMAVTSYFSLLCLSGIQAGLGWVVASNDSWATLCCVQMVAGLSWEVWEDFTYMCGTLVFLCVASLHMVCHSEDHAFLYCVVAAFLKEHESFTFCMSSKSGLEWHFCLILMVRASHRASPDSRKEELDAFFFFFWRHHVQHVGSYSPARDLLQCLLQWRYWDSGILSTGPPA